MYVAAMPLLSWALLYLIHYKKKNQCSARKFTMWDV